MEAIQDIRAAQAPSLRHRIVIVGGGAAGITVAAELKRHDPKLDVAIVEPSGSHSYQPGWTLVGAGVFTRRQTEREEQSLIPKGVTWLKAAVTGFEPDNNLVRMSDGRALGYDYLVACPGLKIDWDAIQGLKDTLGKNGVCSNYRADTAEYTWRLIQDFRGGIALFTQPAMPIKCAGAPQKIMYMMADHLRRRGRLDSSKLKFCLAGEALFGVPFFVPPLQKAVDEYGIDVCYRHNLIAINGPAKAALFSVTDKDGAALRHDLCRPAADRTRCRAGKPAGQRGGLDRGRSGDAASCPLSERLLARRRSVHDERQDGGGRPAPVPRRCRQSAGCHAGQGHAQNL